MKIEKGKLYLDTESNTLFKGDMDIDNYPSSTSDKIAVHCPTKDDWEYIKKQGYDLYQYWGGYSDEPYFILNGGGYVYLTHPDINKYHIITIDQFKEFYPPQVDQDEYSWVNNGLQGVPVKKTFNPKPYYDNSGGSLYKVATDRGWGAYLFDVVKRLERGGKKDPLRQEIEKSIDVLKIWLNEID